MTAKKRVVHKTSFIHVNDTVCGISVWKIPDGEFGSVDYKDVTCKRCLAKRKK